MIAADSEAPAEATKPRFDDLMLAMDAVDTLRHETALVDTELSSDERREALLVRLREYYAGQGIEVSDEILATAVADMDKNRFVHEPLAPGLPRTLALAWVRRGRYLRRTAAIAAVLVIGTMTVSFGYHSMVKAREQAEQVRIAELKADLETRLPLEIRQQHARAVAAAQRYADEAAKAVADNHRDAAQKFVADGMAEGARAEIRKLAALADGIEAKIAIADLMKVAAEIKAAALAGPADAGAKAALEAEIAKLERDASKGYTRKVESAKAALEELRRRIDTPLELRIVDREGVRSGVWRTNDGGSTRVYYLVVEAVDAAGKPVAMDIRNFETGRTDRVTYWGVRVPESEYRKLERDKMSDGVVDDRDAGIKPVGSLGFQWTIPASGGQMITQW